MKSTPNRAKRSGRPEEATNAEQYVLGGGDVGKGVAERLNSGGYAVAFVDESYDSSEFPGQQGDPADLQTLEEAGLADASTVIVAARRDRRNLLIAQLVSAHFDVPRTLVLANTPERSDLLVEAGHETVCATSALSDAVVGNL